MWTHRTHRTHTGALAFVYTGDNNLLTMLQSHCDGCFILSRISGYFIPAAIFVTSIPVYAYPLLLVPLSPASRLPPPARLFRSFSP